MAFSKVFVTLVFLTYALFSTLLSHPPPHLTLPVPVSPFPFMPPVFYPISFELPTHGILVSCLMVSGCLIQNGHLTSMCLPALFHFSLHTNNISLCIYAMFSFFICQLVGI